MKKEIGVLIGIIVLVSATMTVKTANEKKYEIILEVSRGWNLISGLYPPQQISQESDIKQADIKAVWFYSPIEKKYIEIYPTLDRTNLQDYDDEYVFSSSMWVYSDKEGILIYDSIVYSDFPSLETTQLISGWNFVTITPEIDEKSIDDIKGGCNIEKAYLFDSTNQQWGTILNLLDDKNILKDEGKIGGGFVVKVTDNCKFGTFRSLINPPTIPIDYQENDGGKNINFKGTTTGMDWQGNQVSLTDECEEDIYENYLREYYCLDNVVQNEGNFCPSGTTCSNGACI